MIPLLTDSLSETTTPMVVVDTLNKAPFPLQIQPHLISHYAVANGNMEAMIL